jgi:hypothetical protein
MKKLLKLIILIIGTQYLFPACSVDGFENNNSSLTPEESLIASQIIGESVSENQNGLLSSFSESFAIPTPSGLVNGPSTLSTGSFRNLENYSYSFNAETGVHTATFTKQTTIDLISSYTDYVLNYTFFDATGDFIEFPTENMSQIEAVDYRAHRSGEIDAESKKSVFIRTDRLFINGVSDETIFLSIDGFHSGEGLFTQIRTDGSQLEREYLLDLNYLDIRINKPLVLENRNFRTGVNGAFSYEKTIRQTGNGSGAQGTKIINGTVKLNGDGTALLNFRDQFDKVRLRLANGEVFDEDAFEGRVTRILLQEQIIVLKNGQRIQLNAQTEIKLEDFATLEEVALAVDNGVRVIAEGDYFHPDVNVNLWIATEIEFELESNEFDDIITSVDLTNNSFILLNGDQLFITDKSELEFKDNLNSFEDVAEAVEMGMPVVASGDFYVEIETGKRLVKETEFEFDFDEFEEIITSVNTAENSFTLESGKVVLITADTVIKDGDYTSLDQVEEALNNGDEIGAEGQFYYQPLTGFWIAVEVEFFD